MVKEIEKLFESKSLFCKKGHLMFSKKVNYEEKEITAKYCMICDEYYKSSNLTFKEKMKSKEISISDNEYKGEKIKGYKCETCGSDKGYAYSRQMEPSDEPPVVLIRCGNCGTTTRKGG